MKQKKSTKAKDNPVPSKISSKIFEIRTTTLFEKEAKKLKKKYPNVGRDIAALGQKLAISPSGQGSALGQDCFKIRMALSDKNCGKSGGARVIIHVAVINSRIHLLSIYDKSEREDCEIDDILKECIDEIAQPG